LSGHSARQSQAPASGAENGPGGDLSAHGGSGRCCHARPPPTRWQIPPPCRRGLPRARPGAGATPAAGGTGRTMLRKWVQLS